MCCRVFRDAVPATEPKRRLRITGVSKLDRPVPNCVSCSERVEIGIKLKINELSVKEFETKVAKGYLKMSGPDVTVDDGSGKLIISSDDEGEAKNRDKPLAFFGIQDGTRLKCEDSLCDDFAVTVTIHNTDTLPEDAVFVVVDPAGADLAAKAEARPPVEPAGLVKGLKRKLEEAPSSGSKRQLLDSDTSIEPSTAMVTH